MVDFFVHSSDWIQQVNKCGHKGFFGIVQMWFDGIFLSLVVASLAIQTQLPH